ncbi:hypothetical protein EBZ38_14180 [bacterium]|nr:hypothetical protein [Alphaproteobacteria bacterium]NDC95562.1 hypothetical protein [bacterium]NDD85406.1 hypothetical protein [bacterium]
MRNKKITICDYLAEKVPNACYEVLQDSGIDFPKPRNKKELAMMLKKYVQIDRELALKCLARIHPDRELIESVDREVKDADFELNQASQMFGKTFANPFNKKPYTKGTPINAKLNASGCPMCGFDSYANCNGDCKCKFGADGDTSNKMNNQSLIIFSIVAIAILTLINKK